MPPKAPRKTTKTPRKKTAATPRRRRTGKKLIRDVSTGASMETLATIQHDRTEDVSIHALGTESSKAPAMKDQATRSNRSMVQRLASSNTKQEKRVGLLVDLEESARHMETQLKELNESKNEEDESQKEEEEEALRRALTLKREMITSMTEMWDRVDGWTSQLRRALSTWNKARGSRDVEVHLVRRQSVVEEGEDPASHPAIRALHPSEKSLLFNMFGQRVEGHGVREGDERVVLKPTDDVTSAIHNIRELRRFQRARYAYQQWVVDHIRANIRANFPEDTLAFRRIRAGLEAQCEMILERNSKIVESEVDARALLAPYAVESAMAVSQSVWGATTFSVRVDAMCDEAVTSFMGDNKKHVGEEDVRMEGGEDGGGVEEEDGTLWVRPTEEEWGAMSAAKGEIEDALRAYFRPVTYPVQLKALTKSCPKHSLRPRAPAGKKKDVQCTCPDPHVLFEMLHERSATLKDVVDAMGAYQKTVQRIRSDLRQRGHALLDARAAARKEEEEWTLKGTDTALVLGLIPLRDMDALRHQESARNGSLSDLQQQVQVAQAATSGVTGSNLARYVMEDMGLSFSTEQTESVQWCPRCRGQLVTRVSDGSAQCCNETCGHTVPHQEVQVPVRSERVRERRVIVSTDTQKKLREHVLSFQGAESAELPDVMWQRVGQYMYDATESARVEREVWEAWLRSFWSVLRRDEDDGEIKGWWRMYVQSAWTGWREHIAASDWAAARPWMNVDAGDMPVSMREWTTLTWDTHPVRLAVAIHVTLQMLGAVYAWGNEVARVRAKKVEKEEDEDVTFPWEWVSMEGERVAWDDEAARVRVRRSAWMEWEGEVPLPPCAHVTLANTYALDPALLTLAAAQKWTTKVWEEDAEWAKAIRDARRTNMKARWKDTDVIVKDVVDAWVQIPSRAVTEQWSINTKARFTWLEKAQKTATPWSISGVPPSPTVLWRVPTRMTALLDWTHPMLHDPVSISWCTHRLQAHLLHTVKRREAERRFGDAAQFAAVSTQMIEHLAVVRGEEEGATGYKITKFYDRRTNLFARIMDVIPPQLHEGQREAIVNVMHLILDMWGLFCDVRTQSEGAWMGNESALQALQAEFTPTKDIASANVGVWRAFRADLIRCTGVVCADDPAAPVHADAEKLRDTLRGVVAKWDSLFGQAFVEYCACVGTNSNPRYGHIMRVAVTFLARQAMARGVPMEDNRFLHLLPYTHEAYKHVVDDPVEVATGRYWPWFVYANRPPPNPGAPPRLARGPEWEAMTPQKRAKELKSKWIKWTSALHEHVLGVQWIRCRTEVETACLTWWRGILETAEPVETYEEAVKCVMACRDRTDITHHPVSTMDAMARVTAWATGDPRWGWYGVAWRDTPIL
jgi:hypothetical protein